jgi:hypothetical protein
MIPHLFIRCTHTGVYADGRPNTASVLLTDLDAGYEFQWRKTTQYVPAGSYIDIPISDRNLFSFNQGGIAGFVKDGVLIAKLFLQPEIYDNFNRPAATLFPPGCGIWNTSDRAMNYSDGAVWRDAMGVPT